MDETTKKLPPGWVARQSKTYPDRVYYFNTDSGLSSWEFPDIIECYINNKDAGNPNLVTASTSTVVQSSQKTLDKPDASNVSKFENNKKRNMFNPSHNHLFQGLSATHGTRNKTKGLGVSAEPLEKHRPKIWKTSRNHPYCSDSLGKNTKKSPSKQSVSSSKLNTTKIDHFAQKLDTSRTAKSEKKNRSVPSEIKKTRQSSLNSLSSPADDHIKFDLNDSRHIRNLNKTVTKVDNSLINKLKHGKGAVNVDSKHESLKSKMKHSQELKNASTKDPKSNVTELIVKRKVIKSSNISDTKSKQPVIKNDSKEGEKYSMKRKSDYNDKFESASKTKCTPNTNLVNSKSNSDVSNIGTIVKSADNRSKTESNELNSSKHKQKFAWKIQKPKGSNLVNPPKEALNAKLKESKKIVVEEKKDIIHKTEETLCDLRKVVRTIQQNIQTNRDVSLKDNKLPNLNQTNKSVSKQNVKNSSYVENNDLSVHTHVKLKPDVTENVSPTEPVIVSDDEDNEHKTTEYKVFIGDKNKLLNIQSWINNIQEGSASHSPAYDGQLNLSNVNESLDSGYISPAQKRGWPGKLKKSDIASRDMVDMDIEECLLPAPGRDVNAIEEDEVEDMDIDTVLVEVRKEVKNDGNRDLSGLIDWSHPHPNDHVGTVDKTVLVVLDTNIIMSNLSLLKNLKNYTLPGNIKPSLYIPWIVLCELDRLKMNKNKPLVVELAQKGIHFLKDMFKNKHPRIMGQTPKQSDEAAVTFKSACNDDMILQACLQCQQKYEAVVLFSNDNNLAVKSFVMNIPVYNCKDIYFGLREAAQNLSKSTVQTSVVKDQTASHTNTPVNGAQTGSIPDPFSSFQTVTQPQSPVTASWTGSFPNDFSSVQTGSPTPCVDYQAGSVSNHSFQTGLPPNTLDIVAQTGLVPNQTLKPCQSGTLPCQATTSVNYPDRHVTISPSLSLLPNEPNKVCSQPQVRKGQKSSFTDTLPLCKSEPKPSLANEILQEENTYDEDILIADIFRKMKNLLKEALDDVLQNEMQSIYGELWLQIVYKKPPWSLNDILVNLQKHWRAVFNMVFSRQYLKHVDHLLMSTAKVKMNGMCDLLSMVEVICDLLEKVKNSKKYGPKVLVVYNTVIAVRDLCSSVQRGEVCDKKLISCSSQNEPQISLQSSAKKYVVITADDLKPSRKKSQNSTEKAEKTSQQFLKADNFSMNTELAPSCVVTPSMQPDTQPCVQQIDNQSCTLQPNNQSCVLQNDTQSCVLQTDNQSCALQSDNQSCVVQCDDQSCVVQCDDQPCVVQCDDQSCSQPGPSNCINLDAASNSESQEMIAGERLSNIWKFIYQYCEQFHKSVLMNDPSPEIQKEVTPMLQMLVSIAIELRKYFVGLIELSVESLKDYEQEFTSLSEICNNFFTHLNVQDYTSSGTVTPLQLLILYSKPEHRSTLSRFHSQLDEMMNLMYQCLHKLCPDD